MAWTVADGPAGLEGIHTWNAAIALNDRSGGLPYVRLSEITGLYGLPDTDDLRDPRTGRQGEVPRPGFPRGKTAVYSGLIFAAAPQQLRNYTSALRAAFAERALEHPLVISPPAFAGGGPNWQLLARVLGLDIPERQDVGMGAAPTPWQRSFTLTLRLSDGRFVVDAADVDAGAFTDGSTQTVANDGTADTEPTITGTVTSATDVLLENLSVPVGAGHAFLKFTSLPYSGALTVNFDSRQAYVTAGGVAHDLMGHLDPTSSWWDEQVPGLLAAGNSVKVSAVTGWHITHPVKNW